MTHGMVRPRKLGIWVRKSGKKIPNGGPNLLIDSSVSFASDLQDLLPQEHELEDAQYGGPEMDSFLPKIFAPPGGLPLLHDDLQQIDPSFVNLVPNAVQPYDAYMTPHTSQPNSSFQTGLGPYDSQSPMEHWTNHGLLSMLQDWQDVIYSGEEEYAVEHPDFEGLMEKLIKRDLVSMDWRWTVNIEDVDMAFTRAAVEGSRF